MVIISKKSPACKSPMDYLEQYFSIRVPGWNRIPVKTRAAIKGACLGVFAAGREAEHEFLQQRRAAEELAS